MDKLNERMAFASLMFYIPQCLDIIFHSFYFFDSHQFPCSFLVDFCLLLPSVVFFCSSFPCQYPSAVFLCSSRQFSQLLSSVLLCSFFFVPPCLCCLTVSRWLSYIWTCNVSNILIKRPIVLSNSKIDSQWKRA